MPINDTTQALLNVGRLYDPATAPADPFGREVQFQQWFKQLPWYQEFQQQYGEPPDPNDPQYDYRKAYQAGVTPQRYAEDANRYHWASKTPQGDWLKSHDHPTAWAEDFMEATGVDPFSIGIRDPVSADSYLRRGR